MAAQGCALPQWLLLLQLLQLLFLDVTVGARWSGEGTNQQLQSIFLGRCAAYTTLLSLQLGNKNCTAIWEAFKVALDKDPCSVLPSDYDLFINLSRHPIPRDKALFWENNHLLVTSFAENTRRFMPLCNVLYGNVGDFMSWCRQENASGLDYQSCPTAEDCENNAVDSYWKSASMQYSRDSSGVIHVLLNGSEPTGAYPLRGESCGEGSVKILEDRLEALGFQHSCIDDYLPVKLLMCVDHSTHPDCALNSAAASTQRTSSSPYTTQNTSLVISLLVILTSGSQM
ncbi:ADP-ribosyl cyclase/cyclic ADP-ribose hydrolase 2 isoform X2 [Nannospalax galili]|uniref:ADP-ribosyl cyclase/cyclic ADP-ribose hydrolase 2 isoform X2 n=1 Tax=Nannospalax galili TaxID=1026970 RepID=UPI00111C1BFE|nr:ADP-ribosyl cyclase/cyclic ADP-ribose hydrolase 2 isoform X2 [Nannospalax galili]